MLQWERRSGERATIGEQNRQRVLSCLVREKNLSRSAIARQLGLSEGAMSRIVRDLIDTGLVCEVGEIQKEKRVGRRHVTLDLVPDAQIVAVIWLTVFSQGVSIVNCQGNRLASIEFPRLIDRKPDEVSSILAEGVHTLLTRLDLSKNAISGVHVGVVGEVDTERHTIRECSLPNLTSLPLVRELTALLSLRVTLFSMGEVFNIARMHHLARHIAVSTKPAIDGADDVLDGGGDPILMLNVTLGVGTHLAMPNAGWKSAVSERVFGHYKIRGSERRCYCGQTGCLGVEAGGHGILHDLGDISEANNFIDPVLLKSALELASSGDENAVRAFRRAGGVLGRNVYPICAVVRLGRIVLAGSVGRTPVYAEALADGLREVLSGYDTYMPPVFICDLDYQRAAELSGVIVYLFETPPG